MAKTAEGDVDMFDEVDYEPDSDNEEGQQALPDPRPSAKEDRKRDPTAPVTNDCDKEKVMITGIPAGIGKKVRLTFSKALDLKTLTFTHLSLLAFHRRFKPCFKAASMEILASWTPSSTTQVSYLSADLVSAEEREILNLCSSSLLQVQMGCVLS